MNAAETVEALAEGLGVWNGHNGADALLTQTWSLAHVGDHYEVSTSRGTHRLLDLWRLTEADTLLWLHLYALPPERETCPDCEGSKAQHYGVDRDREGPIPWKSWEGWMPGRGPDWCKSRPCPTCKGPPIVCETCGGSGEALVDDERYLPGDCADCSGRALTVIGQPHPSPPRGSRPGQPRGYIEVHRWARRFLGAMPRATGGTERLGVSRAYLEGFGGNEADRKDLAVKADHLQAAGDPLGLWLALWLAQTPCPGEYCQGGERLPPHDAPRDVFDQAVLELELGPRARVNGETWWPCHECATTGLALGAHLPAMVESAQRLASERARPDPDDRRPEAAIR